MIFVATGFTMKRAKAIIRFTPKTEPFEQMPQTTPGSIPGRGKNPIPAAIIPMCFTEGFAAMVTNHLHFFFCATNAAL
jgi:hypothetical protein